MKQYEHSEITAVDIGMRAGWAAAQWDYAMPYDPEHAAVALRLHTLAGRDVVRVGDALADTHDAGLSGRAAAHDAEERLREGTA